MKIKVKPLSVNQLWRGRRFKTPKYQGYELEVFYKLPPFVIPKGKLQLNIVFGFSSSNSDLSNHIKAFEDILQKKYGFNDNRFYRMVIEKEIVKKGEEYITFNIEQYDKNNS